MFTVCNPVSGHSTLIRPENGLGHSSMVKYARLKWAYFAESAPMISALLTKQQVASQFIHSTTKQVDRLVTDGSLHRIKLGKRKKGSVRDNRPVRFRLSEILRLIGMTEDEYRSVDGLVDSGSTTSPMREAE